MKRVWLTALSRDEQGVQQLMKGLMEYGLDVDGSFYEDDLEKMAWMASRDAIVSSDVAAWVLYIKGDSLEKESVRYGLSLLALNVIAVRGHGFPVLALLDAAEVDPETLPTPLAGMELLDANNPAAMAKVVAAAHRPEGPDVAGLEYRIDVYGNPQVGQWFEVGPSSGKWNGAVFGISDGDILFHAVGPRGRLPERSVLNYPVQGMDIRLGELNFAAWGLQNELTGNDSYFVKVEGFPGAIVFGPYPSQDETELFKIRLK